MGCSCKEKGIGNCITRVPIFNDLTQEEMIEVASITTDKTYEKGEMIYMAGEMGQKLYVIHEGKVKITRISEAGKEQVIRVLGSGEFLGELSLFSSKPLTDNGEILERTTLCVIDGRDLKQIMAKYPMITWKIMKELSNRLSQAEILIQDISIHTVEKRLASTLISMSDSKGEIRLKMSKKDLASHIGMSQETLSRKLGSFQEMGIIKLSGHRNITILERESLEEIE